MVVQADVNAVPERRLTRNDVVKLFGTPDDSEGSVNEPRESRDGSYVYNEKWTYSRPKQEPSRPLSRRIYWRRYDFVASERVARDGACVAESEADLVARLERE